MKRCQDFAAKYSRKTAAVVQGAGQIYNEDRRMLSAAEPGKRGAHYPFLCLKDENRQRKDNHLSGDSVGPMLRYLI